MTNRYMYVIRARRADFNGEVFTVGYYTNKRLAYKCCKWYKKEYCVDVDTCDVYMCPLNINLPVVYRRTK